MKRSTSRRSPSSGDRDELLWYFERGAAIGEPPTFGAQLELQLAAAFDSRGHRLARTPAWTFARTVSYRHRPTDGSYVLDEEAALRSGRVARRLHAVRAVDPVAAQALEVHFGPCGTAASHTRFGRLLALVPLVPNGAELARDVLVPSGGSAIDAFEALAAHLVALRADRATASRVSRALAQAEHRLVVAWRRYRATAVVVREHDAPPSSLRRGEP